jgi:hypothetical protein
MRAKDGHQFGPIPSVQELEAVADEIATVATELRDARLDGGFLERALAAARPQLDLP